jgi:cytochrome c biogenesis protein CcmG/thiol:disulfide interchange protein DsbE
MAKLSPLMLAPLVIFAGFAGLALVGLQRDNPNELPSALKGRPAPAVEITALGTGPGFGDSDLRDGEVKLADEKGRMALNWGVYGVPETYVIDGEGNIVLRFAGPITAKVMQSTILPAIENAR